MDLESEKPKPNVAEVTILGTGGGYGESIIIHIGNNKWVIVDSCIDPHTRKNLPLNYLSSIGVNYRENVILIVCTHWHDDHIRGISHILSECLNSTFCMSNQTDKEKFSLFIQMDKVK
jgi:glyoxylase-like metal-dependent hydrolase (beta-lactamase superfamily II)